MNKFIKKNLFFVGVLGLAALGILLLLVLSGMQFLDMIQARQDTQKMVADFKKLNGIQMFGTMEKVDRNKLSPDKKIKNAELIAKDAEGYKNLVDTVKVYYGMTMLPALEAFIGRMNALAFDRLLNVSSRLGADKNEKFVADVKAYREAVAQQVEALKKREAYMSDIQLAEEACKALEEKFEAPADKAAALADQAVKVKKLNEELDKTVQLIAELNRKVGNMQRSLFNDIKKAKVQLLKNVKKEAPDAVVFNFYYGIFESPITSGEIKRLFAGYWEKIKSMGSPHEKIYRDFRNEYGSVPGGAETSAKPKWDTDLWDRALEDAFIPIASNVSCEVINTTNQEEIFLSSLGFPRKLGGVSARLSVYANNMTQEIREKFKSSKVYVKGSIFGSSSLPSLSANASDSRSSKEKSSASSQDESQYGTATGSDGKQQVILGNPDDVIRNWETVWDLAQRVCAANINTIEGLKYLSLTGNTSNNTYDKYTYIITLVSREDDIRKFVRVLGESYRKNRIYAVRRISLNKVDDQVQDIIDRAQNIIGTETSRDDEKNNTNPDGFPESMNNKSETVQTSTYFKENPAQAEFVAGRSLLCRAVLVVDYIVYKKDKLKMQ